MGMPGIICGALLALTLSIDDLVITFFTTGADINTLPVRVFGLIEKSITPKINVIPSLMLAFSLALILISIRLGRGEDQGRIDMSL